MFLHDLWMWLRSCLSPTHGVAPSCLGQFPSLEGALHVFRSPSGGTSSISPPPVLRVCLSEVYTSYSDNLSRWCCLDATECQSSSWRRQIYLETQKCCQQLQVMPTCPPQEMVVEGGGYRVSCHYANHSRCWGVTFSWIDFHSQIYAVVSGPHDCIKWPPILRPDKHKNCILYRLSAAN